MPKRRTNNCQNAEQKTAKTPNEKLPKRRTKNRQNAERKVAKTPNKILPKRRKTIANAPNKGYYIII
jgi:hypothetical protein